MRSERSDSRDRIRIAELAARLLREGSAADVTQARHKAAARMGIRDDALLPSRTEIEAALRQQQALFGGGHAQGLQRKREAALHALEFLHAFEPRLAGPVLDGTAVAHTAVSVHLHVDEPEAIECFLHDQRIGADLATRYLHLQRGGPRVPLPCWTFDADGISFELLVLPRSALQQPPVQAMDGQRLPRASLAQLRQHLATGSWPG
ncbi:hypothetical protein [Stenotrophomonas sp. Marseille-Q4652]|uniref:hypothetical protein n=1 Tax=Stenotrophomonas sp. Marseille-Q4652 TaxID=2866595 RepID=UPI001CE4A6E7|nr:hypothetical protein [Stenotrophomonas sp. Marseille-Q4652]